MKHSNRPFHQIYKHKSILYTRLEFTLMLPLTDIAIERVRPRTPKTTNKRKHFQRICDQIFFMMVHHPTRKKFLLFRLYTWCHQDFQKQYLRNKKKVKSENCIQLQFLLIYISKIFSFSWLVIPKVNINFVIFSATPWCIERVDNWMHHMRDLLVWFFLHSFSRLSVSSYNNLIFNENLF